MLSCSVRMFATLLFYFMYKKQLHIGSRMAFEKGQNIGIHS